MISSSVRISILDNPSDAPNYGSDFTMLQMKQCIVVGKGTENNHPSVDVQLQDQGGGKFVVMATGGLLEMMASSVAGKRKLDKREQLNTQDLEQLVLAWAADKGIFEKSDPKSQTLKFMSEAGELADEVNIDGDLEALTMELGDVLVTLTLLARMKGLTLAQCLAAAYTKINTRKGKMTNGVFVKEEGIKELPLDKDTK